MNAPTLTSWPLTWKPSPVSPPLPAEFTSGVMMLSVNALITVLNASAITSPIAMTMMSPCMRKFLNPRMADMAAPFLDPVELPRILAQDPPGGFLDLVLGEQRG